MATASFSFPPFRLDLENQVLWNETQLVPLRPKTFAVLRYLVEHAGQFVTRTELSNAVWSATKVTPQVLRASLWELRHALGDTTEHPHFFETVSQQGWRFIAEVVSSQHSVASRKSTESRSQESEARSSPSLLHDSTLNTQRSVLVGREAELAQLHSWLATASQGERQLVFVTGEPGIGKTTLIDAFVAALATDPRIWVARGQCIEHYGVGEAYMPVLAALEQLTQNMADDLLVTLLQRYAPLWLVQMPSLLEPAELADLQRQLAGTTRERMLRELATFLEAFTVDTTLVLALEDLHWSDPATVNLLAYLARRREPARLLILGSYRPTDLLADGHPLQTLVQELHVQGQSHEIALTGLSGPAVAQYVQARFPGSIAPPQLGQICFQRTEGHPFFLVSLLDELVNQEVLRFEEGQVTWQGGLMQLHEHIPLNLRSFFAQRRARLTEQEHMLLEAASLAGLEFSAALVAAVLNREAAEVEEQCEALVQRQQFLRPAGISEWPDGTVAARYGFHHALCQQLWHERVPLNRHQQWHLRMGVCLEHAYGERAGEIATELAIHFEQGRDYQRAVRYLQQAGRTAMQRNAPTEAIQHFSKGIALLTTLPATRERAQQEVALQIALGAPLGATKGVGAPEAEQAFSRARALCAQLGQSPELIPALWGLAWFSIGQGKPRMARELGEQLVDLTRNSQPTLPRLLADNALGAALFWTGDFPRARFYLEQGIALYDPRQHRSPAYVTDLGVLCRCYATFVLWILGYPDQARNLAREALTLARELCHAHSVAQTLCHTSIVHQLCREAWSAQEVAQQTVTVSMDQGFPLWSVTGVIVRAWAWAEQGRVGEGVEQLRRALTAYSAINSSIMYPYFLGLLADTQRKAAHPEEGLAAVTEALARVAQTGARYYEAELWRLKGELLLAQAQRETLDSI